MGLECPTYADTKHAYLSGVVDSQIADVSNPAAPVRLGSYDPGLSSSAVAAETGIAYAALSELAFDIYDVSTPTAPARLYAVNTDVAGAGDYAFVTDGTAGVHLVEV